MQFDMTLVHYFLIFVLILKTLYLGVLFFPCQVKPLGIFTYLFNFLISLNNSFFYITDNIYVTEPGSFISHICSTLLRIYVRFSYVTELFPLYQDKFLPNNKIYLLRIY